MLDKYNFIKERIEILLYELERTIGRENFIELLTITHMNNIDTTEKFLKRLGKITNQEIEENF